MHFCAADAGTQHGLGLDRPTTHRQASEHGSQFVDIGTGIDERTEGHIAGDAREAVEPGDPRCRPIGRGDGDALPGHRPLDHGVDLRVGVRTTVVGVMRMIGVVRLPGGIAVNVIVWFRHRAARTRAR